MVSQGYKEDARRASLQVNGKLNRLAPQGGGRGEVLFNYINYHARNGK